MTSLDQMADSAESWLCHRLSESRNPLGIPGDRKLAAQSANNASTSSRFNLQPTLTVGFDTVNQLIHLDTNDTLEYSIAVNYYAFLAPPGFLMLVDGPVPSQICRNSVDVQGIKREATSFTWALQKPICELPGIAEHCREAAPGGAGATFGG